MAASFSGLTVPRSSPSRATCNRIRKPSRRISLGRRLRRFSTAGRTRSYAARRDTYSRAAYSGGRGLSAANRYGVSAGMYLRYSGCGSAGTLRATGAACSTGAGVVCTGSVCGAGDDDEHAAAASESRIGPSGRRADISPRLSQRRGARQRRRARE